MFEDGTVSPYKYRLVRERGLPREARALTALTPHRALPPRAFSTSVLPCAGSHLALARPRHDMRQWVARLGQRLYDRGFRTYHKEINIQHTTAVARVRAGEHQSLPAGRRRQQRKGIRRDGGRGETRSRQRRQRSRRHGQHEERMPRLRSATAPTAAACARLPCSRRQGARARAHMRGGRAN